MSDISDALESNATGPAEVTTDAGTVKQHSLKDQIEADKYLTNKSAVEQNRRGLRFNKLVPPGTV